jgi:hypothetical protein
MAKLQAFGSKKLNAFGSKKPAPKPTAPAQAATNGRVKKGKVQLRRFGTDDTPRKHLEELLVRIDKTQAQYIEAFKLEKVNFKTVDKLERAHKTDTDAFHKAKTEWDASWTRLDALYGALHQLNGSKRIMEKAINERHR